MKTLHGRVLSLDQDLTVRSVDLSNHLRSITSKSELAWSTVSSSDTDGIREDFESLFGVPLQVFNLELHVCENMVSDEHGFIASINLEEDLQGNGSCGCSRRQSVKSRRDHQLIGALVSWVGCLDLQAGASRSRNIYCHPGGLDNSSILGHRKCVRRDQPRRARAVGEPKCVGLGRVSSDMVDQGRSQDRVRCVRAGVASVGDVNPPANVTVTSRESLES